MSQRPLRVFLAAGCIALAAGLVVGVSDNPPGLILVYLAGASFILAFAHRWRTVRSYVMKTVAEALRVAFFLIAVFLCPVGVLIGGVGGVITWRRTRGALS